MSIPFKKALPWSIRGPYGILCPSLLKERPYHGAFNDHIECCVHPFLKGPSMEHPTTIWNPVSIPGIGDFCGPFFFFGGPFFSVWAGGLRTMNCHADRGGRACTDRGCSRKMQNCHRFWPPLLSSRLKSVYSHRDRGVLVATLRTVVDLSLACCPRISEGLHIFCCNCFCCVFGFVLWSLFRVWAL